MNIIPRIRPGEELSIDKLNAIIDKVNSIETSKKELELLQDSVRSDIEKHNAIMEGIQASQNALQQITGGDALETITSLLTDFINNKTNTSSDVTQLWGMREITPGTVEIYLKENGIETAAFTLTQGSDGPQGERGIQGEQGPQGPSGPIGPRGFRGITGKQGEGSSVKADYVEYVGDMSLLPNDTQQYLRIQIKRIDSEGIETLQDTCYIPTKGYIYIPEIYSSGGDDNTAYIRFKKVINADATASTLLDSGWRITGPQGPQGKTGPKGVPGTGLTCSNLVRLTSDNILSRNPTPEEEIPSHTLEDLLKQAASSSYQDEIIYNVMKDIAVPENVLFGIIPLNLQDGVDNHTYTLIERTDTGWQLLRHATFPITETESLELHDNSLENNITQELTYGGATYYKLITGASFMYVPAIDADFKTYLYTVYDRACIDTLTSDKDADKSFYILVENTVNAGIEVKNLNTDNFTAKNITLPEDELNPSADAGIIKCSTLRCINLICQHGIIHCDALYQNGMIPATFDIDPNDMSDVLEYLKDNVVYTIQIGKEAGGIFLCNKKEDNYIPLNNTLVRLTTTSDGVTQQQYVELRYIHISYNDNTLTVYGVVDADYGIHSVRRADQDITNNLYMTVYGSITFIPLMHGMEGG